MSRLWTRQEDPLNKAVRWVLEDPSTDDASLAFVVQWVDNHLVITKVRDADVRGATRGHTISIQDLKIVQQVTKRSFREKYTRFREQTEALRTPEDQGRLQMRIEESDRIHVESIEQVLAIEMEYIHMAIHVEYGDKLSISNQEWIVQVMLQLFQTEMGLFRPLRGHTTHWTIHPKSLNASADHLLYFRGIGRLFGRALLEGLAIPTRVASFVTWELEPEVYKTLQSIVDHPVPIEELNLHFCIPDDTNEDQVDELKESGRVIPVTDENKLEYVELRMRHVLVGEGAEQLDCLIAGVFEVIPQEILLPFTLEELSRVLFDPQSLDEYLAVVEEM